MFYHYTEFKEKCQTNFYFPKYDILRIPISGSMITIPSRDILLAKPLPEVSPYYLKSKRALDLVGGSVLFIISLPLWLIIFILIKLESRGPVIISQQRIGYKGKLFTMYKFRTMHAHVNLYEHAPKQAGDKRITRFGKLLRQTSLDELPQVLNILNGSMSLVGPRPEMSHVVATYEPWQHIRFEAKPGLTGLWQVCGRKDLPLTENIEFDIYYIHHQSVILDTKILVRTIPVVIGRRGAY
jgi:lipopolysaccharide/colanic/teichoic acid biosynthesis glycosyltransferase